MRLGCSLLLLALLLSGAAAQSSSGIDSDVGNPGLGGKNTIEGRIFYPSGQPFDKRVRIKVTSVRGGPSSVMSDDRGAFTMLRLIDGTYNFTVDAGPEYETATESVQLVSGARGSRSATGQTVFVQIKLRFKDAYARPPGIISATLATIPKPARDLYEQALNASQSGNHKKAIDLLKKALTLSPKFVLALNELGMQYLQLNELDRAAETLGVAVKEAPTEFIPALNYGLVLLQQKNYAAAEESLRSAIAKDDTSAPAHEYLGRALIGLQKFEEAEKELLRAVSLGGERVANSHRYLGALYLQLGDDARAIVELTEYLRLQPKVKDAEQVRQIIRDLSAKQEPKQ